VPSLDQVRLPRHIAIIMDGNGRWAQGQGRARTLGHEEGSKAVRTIVREARRLGVSALTLYAFSEQNWQRPDHEVEALMALLRAYLVDERSELMDNEIRLRAVGRRHKLPESVREVLEPLERDTAHLTKMTLTLAISYGGREELVDAARALACEAKAGTLDPASIDEKMLEAAMPSTDVGPVDLLIRTGGEQRISNFLIWSSAYAELVFTDTLWPDMTEADLHEAIATYQRRERRFGLVPSAIATPVTP
jgi:undecaprenyl diphosphate synthase